MQFRLKTLPILPLLSSATLGLSGCVEQANNSNKVTLEVTATAYTSHPNQTDDTPYLAAWNNVLKPGVKSIAVSRDLLKMGIKNGTKITIEGLKGEFVVLDKMHKRWEKKIDIYMGHNHDKAKQWGKQTVTISWHKSNIK